jgi:hypothetical protein
VNNRFNDGSLMSVFDDMAEDGVGKMTFPKLCATLSFTKIIVSDDFSLHSFSLLFDGIVLPHS